MLLQIRTSYKFFFFFNTLKPLYIIINIAFKLQPSLISVNIYTRQLRSLINASYYTFGMYGLDVFSTFKLFTYSSSFLFITFLLLSMIRKIEKIVGKVGHDRSRTIFEDFQKPLAFLFLLVSLIYLDENLRRLGILEKMICLIVRGREISRSYHFYSDVPCNLLDCWKKYGAIVCKTFFFTKTFYILRQKIEA